MKSKLTAIIIFSLLLNGCMESDSTSERESTLNDDREAVDAVQDDELISIQMEQHYQVSGTIFVADNTKMDGDRNDPNTQQEANAPITHAQQLRAPATIGGYLNQPNQGPEGRLFSQGDKQDFYKATLLKDQTLTLRIAGSPETNDIDLYLYDSNFNLIDASVGTSYVEWIKVPNAGDYIISVELFEGVDTTATNYTLNLGNQAAPLSVSYANLSHDFVAAEGIVEFEASAVNAVKGAKDRERKIVKLTGHEYKKGQSDRPMLLSLNLDHSQAKSLVLGNHKKDAPEIKISAEMQEKLNTLLALKTLHHRDDVRAAEPNFLLLPMAEPNDTYYSLQWHYPFINLPQAWDITTGERNVTVAVIDTGVLLNHPDFTGQLVAGYDFISHTSISNDGDGIDPNPDDPGDSSDGRRNSYHGTHVAGTVAATSNNSSGVAGVAWNVNVMPVRVLGIGGGTGYDVIQGVRYAAGLPNDSGTVPSKPAGVINLSLGGAGYSSFSENVYLQARAAGSIIIAAAGNSDVSTPFYPAGYQGVVAVSSVNLFKQKTYYSNYGNYIDVAAPGGESRYDLNFDGYPDMVLSTVGNNDGTRLIYSYKFYQGTSMASPHVAGVAALMKSVYPELTPDEFDSLLTGGHLTSDIGAAGWDNISGYGLIDAHKAVVSALELAGGTPPVNEPKLISSHQELDFGTLFNGMSVTFGNFGEGELSITSFSHDAGDWFTITPDIVDENGLGNYDFEVRRQGLTIGTYSATLTVESTINNLEIPITLQIAERPNAGDAGTHYVILIDVDEQTRVADAQVEAINGAYTFTLTDVPAGRYYIFSGSDSNNDDFICDSGEICGAYPLVQQPDIIEVIDNDINGIEFDADFGFFLLDVQEQSSLHENASVREKRGWKRK